MRGSGCPRGCSSSRYYWDVESGEPTWIWRSQAGTWQQFADAGIPRDGGMAELRAAVACGSLPFSAVICENIEWSGWTCLTQPGCWEHELRAAGLPVFATDEPMDAQAPEAATIRWRWKQAWPSSSATTSRPAVEGLRQVAAIAGFNTGPVPTATADRSLHPNPMKRLMARPAPAWCA